MPSTDPVGVLARRPAPPMPKGAEKYGAWFDHAAADAACAFFPTYLRHTEAEWYGRPFKLQLWQEDDIIRPIFGWKRADGTRLIRVAYIEIPRKNGKTELAAGISLLALLGDREYGGQAYSMAVDKEQAKIVFNKAGMMVTLSPELTAAIEVLKTSLYCPELQASFKPLSSTPGSKHGFSPSFAIGDEVHEWPDGELHDVVHKGTAARRQPLEILITTAGQPGIGYGWEMHSKALDVIAGNVIDPSFHAIIYAADPADDWMDPATWAKANPNLGVSVKRDYLETEVANATTARRKGDFKRYHLNIWTDQVQEGLDMAAWDACRLRPVTLEMLAGRQCWGGLDLASTTDLAGLVLAAPAADGSDLIDVWAKAFMPVPSDRALKERVRNDRVPFDDWIEQGWIIGTPGDVIDYDAIRWLISGQCRPEADLAYLRRDNPVPVVEMVELVELAIDRWNATQITTHLTDDGVTVVPFGQGFASMSAPSKELERLIAVGGLNHGANPVLRWMASCVQFSEDGAENRKPVKPDRRKNAKRIDLIVALLMALGRLPVREERKTFEISYQRGQMFGRAAE